QVHLRGLLKRLGTALALLGILAIAQGCGGGDSETTATTTAGAPGSASAGGSDGAGAEAPKGSGEGAAGNGSGGGSGESGGGAAGGSHGPGLAEKAKPDTKGFKAPPGGDNSIQTYGEEAESTEEEEITTAMASFLRALANRDYPAICEGLSEANRGQLE